MKVILAACLCLITYAATAPVVPPSSVVNNASFATGTTALAPGTIAAIFGSDLDDGSKNPFSSFGVNGELLTTLGGASVTFNGIPAPIFSAFPGQLNVQIPLELAGQTSAQVVVTVASQSSAAQTVPVSSESPGIFSINQTGKGQGAIQIANSTTYAAPAGSIGGSQSRAVKAGEFVTIFCTGLGAVNDTPGTGKPASSNPLSKTTITPEVTIGGVLATVSFSGLAPGFVGEYQVDVQIPEGLSGGGAVPVVLSINGVQSNTVTIAIDAPVAQKIAGGEQHTCVVTSAGGVLCWGENQYGQLGNGTTTDSLTPTPVTGLSSGVASITAGQTFTCALMKNGSVMCWGYNFNGELGNGAKGGNADSHVPVQVMDTAGSGPLTGVVAISSGHSHTCAVTSARTVLCWGLNGEGALSQPSNTSQTSVPLQVTDIPAGITAVSAGSDYTCALTSAGAMWCWGLSGFGQLGMGPQFPNSGTAVAVKNPAGNAALSGVASMNTGYEDTCAILTNSSLLCWGANRSAEDGNGNNSQQDLPVAVVGASSSGSLTGISQVTGGDDHTCALTNSGGVLCWGSNSNGQTGTGPGSNTDPFTPQQVVGLTSGVTEIASGYRHNCAITSSGGVMCWGSNARGQVGNGNKNDQDAPVQVLGVGGSGLLKIF
jgi:uncharacterized protein (TIGR03437 family)